MGQDYLWDSKEQYRKLTAQLICSSFLYGMRLPLRATTGMEWNVHSLFCSSLSQRQSRPIQKGGASVLRGSPYRELCAGCSPVHVPLPVPASPAKSQPLPLSLPANIYIYLYMCLTCRKPGSYPPRLNLYHCSHFSKRPCNFKKRQKRKESLIQKNIYIYIFWTIQSVLNN